MDDPVLKTTRREAVVALGLFGLSLAATVGVSAWLGFGRDPASLTFILGVPDWVFWGVLCPWAGCFLAAFWFAFRFMKDADLGPEPPEEKP
jgi:hypothetical protein